MVKTCLLKGPFFPLIIKSLRQLQINVLPVESGAEEVDDALLLHLLLDLGVLGEVQQQVVRHSQGLLLSSDQDRGTICIMNLHFEMILHVVGCVNRTLGIPPIEI